MYIGYHVGGINLVCASLHAEVCLEVQPPVENDTILRLPINQDKSWPWYVDFMGNEVEGI